MTTDYRSIRESLTSACGELSAVAVAFLKAPPSGVARFEGSEPSGCSFWSLAAAGRAFYTVPSDHFNCPIGSYTHNLDVPADRSGELPQTLGLMSDIGYLRMAEVPAIPRLPSPPAFIYYAPLEATAVTPDVVILAGAPGALMRVQEAASRAGAASQLPLLGRPTCMALPAAMAHGSVMSLGCIGNRVYTELGSDEMYVMVPGNRIEDVGREAAVTGTANATLEAYHRDRRAALRRTSQVVETEA